MSDLNHKNHLNGTKNNIYIRTPLIESQALSKLGGCSVYLKLENTQPCGSFKLRGLSNLITKKISEGCKSLVASSGGNAGMAAAFCAKRLNIPLTLYTPQSTGQQMRERLAAEGATVVVHGRVWDEADKRAREDCKDPTVAYVPPFDHPDVWEGHESMIFEMSEQLPTVSGGAISRPDLVIVSVGGGGLLVGVSHGMDKVGWGSVPILAMETEGANCFNAAIKAGHIVTLPGITSIANCLGALTVCSEAYKCYNTRPIISELVSDKQCVQALSAFLDDERILVEPACAASVSAFYSGLIQRLRVEGKLTPDLKSIVLVVCGGVGVSQQQLAVWKKQFSV